MHDGGVVVRSVRTVLLLVVAAMVTAAADPPPPVWQGVWLGRIGTLPIRACLLQDGVGNGFGAYYYAARLRTIRLEQRGGSREWIEGWSIVGKPPAARWRFASVGRDTLSGSWSDGRRDLPFRLTRIADGDDDGMPCGTEAFNGPRWRPLTVTRTAAVQDGVAYTRLAYHAGPAFPDIVLTGFALGGTDAAGRRIDAALREELFGKNDDWRSCVVGGLDAHGEDGDVETTITPTLITPRWLSASVDSSEDCGGAHPNSATSPITYDRSTGRAVDLHGWLGDAAFDRSGGDGGAATPIRPALRAVLIALAKPDADCSEAWLSADVWEIGLDRAGLAFTPDLSHAEQACADPVVLPWRAAARFLSPAGRVGQATLVARHP